MYDEHPAAYFPFLGLVTKHLSTLTNTTDSNVLSRALNLIKTHRVLPVPSSLSTLQYALGIHTAVPKLEAYFSWYESSVDENRLAVEACGSWVEWKGKGFCEVEELKKDIELSIEDGTLHE